MYVLRPKCGSAQLKIFYFVEFMSFSYLPIRVHNKEFSTFLGCILLIVFLRVPFIVII